MAQFGIQRNGIFIDGLEAWVTTELLWKKFTEESISGLQTVKIPRDITTKVVKGYAFCGFDTRENAIAAKSKLNYINLLGKNVLRVALITQEKERSQESNFIVQNLPENMEPKAFDEEISKYGTLVSSKITSKGFGHVQFLRKEEADKFNLACLNGKVIIGGQTIKAQVFKRHVPKPDEKKNLFLKEIKDQSYTKEQLQSEEFKKTEALRITELLKTQLGEYGPIASAITSFSKDYNNPFSFVCFQDTESATKCFEAINKDDEFLYNFKAWSLTKKELIQQREANRDKRFIFMRGIKKTVTQAQMFKILSEVLKINSIRLREPSLAKYKTQYATIITEEENKLDFIKSTLKEGAHKNQEFIDLFESRPYITYCFPIRQHKQWLKNKLNKEFGGSYPPFMAQQRGMQPILPQQMMPPMIPKNMPPGMNFPPMGMQGMQQLPQMFMPPPGYPMMPPMQMQGMPRPQMHMQQQPQQQQQHYNNNKPQRTMNPNNYQRNQQQRPQHHNNNNNNNQRPQYNNNRNNNNNNNNNRGRPAQYQPKPAQPRPVQPKPVQQAQGQQQQPQQQAITIQSLRAKWADFKTLPPQQQVKILGTMLFPMVSKLAKDQTQVQKITSILVDLTNFTIEEIAEMIESPAEVKERVEEAEELLKQ